MPRLTLGAALAAIAIASGLAGAAAAPGAEPPACAAGISRETAARLFATLNRRPAEADCAFEGVGTARTALEARWSRAGAALPPLRVVPRACAPAGARLAGDFAVEVPAEIAAQCPSVAPALAAFLDQLRTETPAGRFGSTGDPLFRGAQALFAAIALLCLGLLLRGLARWRTLDPGIVAIGLSTFAAALALRAALPFTLGNWYSEVLPAAGPPPWMRFGPGSFALQSLLRDAGLWSPGALTASQLLLGAAALPLLLGVLRELQVGIAAAAATLVLLIFAPFHARLSASASEHVLAATLCLALLLAWLRAVRTGDRPWLVLALLLFPAVCATRVDMAAQAAAVLPWPLLRDRGERARGLHGWPLAWRVAVMGMAAAATLVIAYRGIVVASHHPTPDWSGHRFALRYALPQFWILATTDPGWISLPAVLLAVPGALAMAARRPLLLARVAGTVLFAFVALGRTFLHDELLGARYFLFVIPVFLIASGCGFEALLAPLPRRVRALAAAAGLAGLAAWTGYAARPAYAARYAFQDEYRFARRALALLPAGCTVYQIALRAGALPHDVDCCLDLARSPLALDFPALRFEDLPDDPGAAAAGSGCAAYYEGIACEIGGGGDPAEREFAGRVAAYFQPRCAAMRRLGRLEPLAQIAVSPRSSGRFFEPLAPRATLYRWRR